MPSSPAKSPRISLRESTVRQRRAKLHRSCKTGISYKEQNPFKTKRTKRRQGNQEEVFPDQASSSSSFLNRFVLIPSNTEASLDRHPEGEADSPIKEEDFDE